MAHAERHLPTGKAASPVPAREISDASFVASDLLLRLDPVDPELASWGNIGGCGAGTGGGGGGVRWMGRRAPAGWLMEFELMGSRTSGEDLTSTSLTLKATAELGTRLTMGVSAPYVWNTRHDDNFTDLFGLDYDLEAKGFGDMGLTFAQKLGQQGYVSANLSVGLPTAEHDKQELGSYYHPSDAQVGKGVTTVSVAVERSFLKDWGMIVVGGGYDYNGGENDIGNRAGNAYNGFVYVGRNTEGTVHSVGVKVSRALEKAMNLGAFPEGQGRTLVTFQYGFELSSGYLPLFVGVTATVGDDSAANSTGIALGIITSF